MSKYFKIFYIGALVILIILVIASWFYWFQWRPSEIRKECGKAREDYLKKIAKESWVEQESTQSIISLSNFKYERCLNHKGLK